jgi:NAD(P)-dependent dehydrogenase (short-subunit alcohol dehydrogenase family)
VNDKEELNPLGGTTAIVTGASRGFGRSIASALAAAGVHVVGVARSAARLAEVTEQLGDGFTAVTADAADPATAHRLIDAHEPTTVVLCAGAAPTMSPLQDQTWETFSQNWSVDVAQAFHWTRAALTRPLAPGSSVIALSSGAALKGSPLSGGYAGAKATVRFITSYAAGESERNRLGIEFLSLLPQLTPDTDLGLAAVQAYAGHQGVDVDAFVEAMAPVLTSETVAKTVLDIASGRMHGHHAYALASAGASALD